jgi:hypothetical protein
MIWRREKSVMRKSDPTITNKCHRSKAAAENRFQQRWHLVTTHQSVAQQNAGYPLKSSSPFQRR